MSRRDDMDVTIKISVRETMSDRHKGMDWKATAKWADVEGVKINKIVVNSICGSQSQALMKLFGALLTHFAMAEGELRDEEVS